MIEELFVTQIFSDNIIVLVLGFYMESGVFIQARGAFVMSFAGQLTFPRVSFDPVIPHVLIIPAHTTKKKFCDAFSSERGTNQKTYNGTYFFRITKLNIIVFTQALEIHAVIGIAPSDRLVPRIGKITP
jgi:hypothetical protein